MRIAWGIVLVVLGGVAWVGQVISLVAPPTAVRLGLREADETVDPVYAADIRGEAAWDACTLWTLVAAGALLIADQDAWRYFGLVGGGMYVYFAGRGIATRVVMRAAGHRIGTDEAVRNALLMLAVWAAVAAVTIAAAAVAVAA